MANANPNSLGLPQSPFVQASQSVTLGTIFTYLKDSDSRMSVYLIADTSQQRPQSQAKRYSRAYPSG